MESYLLSRDIEVKLLDAHTFPYAPTAAPMGQNAGLRLVVRADQLELARAALKEAQSPLALVSDEPSSQTPIDFKNETASFHPMVRWLTVSLLLLMALIYYLSGGQI